MVWGRKDEVGMWSRCEMAAGFPLQGRESGFGANCRRAAKKARRRARPESQR